MTTDTQMNTDNTGKSKRTYLPKVGEVKRQWYEADASAYPLGRLATRVATILRGKHKAVFTPHMDLGDFVVVKNAEKIKVTGRKALQKEYFRFSGYPGGITSTKLKDLLEKRPQEVIRRAVSGMLPKNRQRKQMMKRLKIVDEDKHTFKIDRNI